MWPIGCPHVYGYRSSERERKEKKRKEIYYGVGRVGGDERGLGEEWWWVCMGMDWQVWACRGVPDDGLTGWSIVLVLGGGCAQLVFNSYSAPHQVVPVVYL